MPLVQPNALREKILLIGGPKVGKTSCWLSTAWWAWKSGDPRHFYVIDTDDAVEAVMLDEKFAGMDNVTVYAANEWEEYESAGETARSLAKEGDWIVVDFADKAWKAVQNYYLREVRKKSRADALMDASKKGAQGWDLFREDFDWASINAVYDEWIKPLLLGAHRAHLFFVTEQAEIIESSKMTDEQKRAKREFGRFKPTGQKSLPYQVRSILRLDRIARGRIITTLGDRARKELENDDMNDFFRDYLRDVAGWSVVDTGVEAEAG